MRGRKMDDYNLTQAKRILRDRYIDRRMQGKQTFDCYGVVSITVENFTPDELLMLIDEAFIAGAHYEKTGMVYGQKKIMMEENKMAAGARRKGKPRSEAERKERHKRLHPGTKLPPRGTGLKKTSKK